MHYTARHINHTGLNTLFSVVPEFELVWISCFRDGTEIGRHWSFRAQGKDFKLRPRNEPSLSCPSNLEMAINTTHSVIKRRDNMCCEHLDVLKPEDARSFLSVCDGKIVRSWFFLCVIFHVQLFAQNAPCNGFFPSF